VCHNFLQTRFLQSFLENVQRPLPPTVISKEERLFFQYLERANIHDKAAVDDFTCHILRMLDFDDDDRSVVTRKEFPFTMCGSHVGVKADIVAIDGHDPPLIVQLDRVSAVRTS